MNVITIPREFTRGGDLVVIPRDEYEAFSEWKKSLRIHTVRPTPEEVQAIRRGRQEIKKGKYVTWEKFKRVARRTR